MKRDRKIKTPKISHEQACKIQLAESMRIAYLKKPYSKEELRHRSVREILESEIKLTKPLPEVKWPGMKTIHTLKKGESFVSMVIHKEKLYLASTNGIYELNERSDKLKRIKLVEAK